MCEYCQGLQNDEFRRFGSGVYADLYQGYSSVGGWVLHVDMHPCAPWTDCISNVCYRGKKKGFRIKSLTQNFPINFCPNCGRGLRTKTKGL